MASSPTPSSPLLTTTPISLSLGTIINYISIKLDESNYLLWRSQFVPILVANDLYGYVDGSVTPPQTTIKSTEGKEIPNPNFFSWCKVDQFVLSCINATLTQGILAQTLRHSTAHEVWESLHSMFLEQSQARFDLLKGDIQSIQKGDTALLSTYGHISHSTGSNRFSQQPQTQNRGCGQNFKGKPYLGKCQICRQQGHSAAKCPFRFKQNYNLIQMQQAFAAMNILETTLAAQPPNSDPCWYPDTGATSHMIADMPLLKQTQEYSGSDSVMVGNGASLPISHIGNIYFHSFGSQFQLKDVLYVPSIKKNLLSVAKFTIDNNCSFHFFPWGYCIKDLATRRTLLMGTIKDNLYPLHLFGSQLRPPNGALSQETTFLTSKTTPEVWHNRLGHPNFQVVTSLSSNKCLEISGALNKTFVCAACQMGKIPSISGYQYYIVFIDDFSRFIWLYPIKLKSDSVACFLHFKKMMENLLSTKIKYFQSDGALELTKGAFKYVLVDCGIIPQISCPHTQQQNGIVERKHRHITELRLSLMFHSFMPKPYWLEAFSTVAYLINRLPTPVLNSTSPYEVLFNTRPDYSHLHTFRCACYPYLEPYKHDKLSPKSILCVFLGYSTHSKGYRCLDHKTSIIYTSCHVVFDESTFPFTSMVSTSPTLATHHQWVNLPIPSQKLQPSPISSPSPSLSPSPQPSTSPPSISLPQPNSSPLTVQSELVLDTLHFVTPPNHSIPDTPPPSSLPTTNVPPNPPSPPPFPLVPSYPMVTRLKSGIVKPKYHSYLTTKYSLPQAFVASLPSPAKNEPVTYHQASKDPH
uniref:Integrase catalytic domain-containing protein n=1 Tax=Fagus sylvatica TaxID=28930 RepID=A0A2N9IIX6_FAGSY